MESGSTFIIEILRPLNDLGVLSILTLINFNECRLKATLPRKEVIQPHLPVQLPCYDLVPVIDPTLGTCLPDKSELAQ